MRYRLAMALAAIGPMGLPPCWDVVAESAPDLVRIGVAQPDRMMLVEHDHHRGCGLDHGDHLCALALGPAGRLAGLFFALFEAQVRSDLGPHILEQHRHLPAAGSTHAHDAGFIAVLCARHRHRGFEHFAAREHLIKGVCPKGLTMLDHLRDAPPHHVAQPRVRLVGLVDFQESVVGNLPAGRIEQFDAAVAQVHGVDDGRIVHAFAPGGRGTGVGVCANEQNTHRATPVLQGCRQ